MNDRPMMPSVLTTSTDLVDHQAFAAELLRGMAENRSTVLGTSGGPPLLKLSKFDGSWGYGQNNEDVQEGARLAIGGHTVGWGWEAWPEYKAGEKNKPLGRVVNSIAQPMPPRPAPVQGREYQPYVTFCARILDGDDTDLVVMYGASTKGGVNAFSKLKDLMFARLQRDPVYFCPVITLGHTFNADVYYPVFNIVGWADLDGNLAPIGNGQVAAPTAATTAAAPAPAEPARKRKAPLGNGGAAAQETAPAPAQPDPRPVSTQAAHTGQRRRHRPAA